MKKNIGKLALIIIASIVAYFFFKNGLHEQLTLESIKSNQDRFINYYENNSLKTILIYLAIYITSTALSLPGATILTLLGGAIFGLINGVIIVSFASTIGATLAFLGSRFIFKDWVQERFSDKLKTINDGVQREGAFYLFTLRLIPIFPFFLINLVMGLTPIKTLTFFFVSQVGMLLGTIVYVNAGVELSKIDSLKSIVSPSLLFTFAALGLVPFVAKAIVSYIRSKKVYKDFKKPKSFDYNMVAIGGGAAGLVTSYIGAVTGAKVALIEKNKMGGDCLNTGCVPSKALIRTAKIVHQASNAKKYGLTNTSIDFDFKNIMKRVHDVIAKIEPHDSVERYTNLGVDCIEG
ncbi:MAG: VTT domain-containing protein, partial [Bdellovibrionota bacterium]|nr:VTT domain-containing protein [Bdellovibrionota bacterium]